MNFELFSNTVRFLAAHLASFAAIGASAWIFGETILRRLALGRCRERWALAATLGWGLIAQSMFLLGVLGLLERAIVLGLLALGHLACLRTWRSVFDGWRRPSRSLIAGCLVALPCLVLALYPPTGFDATVYHLPYARAFVESGGLEFLPDLRFPVFPQAGEMGFVLGFFLSGEIAARLTQLLAMLLTAGLLFDWGRLYDRRAGFWAAALWLGNPLIVWLGASAYVDATLALFVTASFLVWERWIRDGDGRWLWLAGAFGGLAAATKYLGLFFLTALGAMTAMHAVKARAARPLVVLSAVALAVLAPWYLRIVYHTGNPVFPFYAPVFGSSEWATLHDQALPAAGAEAGASALFSVAASQGGRIVEGLSFLAMVPWTAVFDRGVFHWQAPLSPWYLLLLPLCAPFALLERRRRRLVVLVAVYGLFWLTTVRDLRFLVAAMPALNVALAATLSSLLFAGSSRSLGGGRTKQTPGGGRTKQDEQHDQPCAGSSLIAKRPRLTPLLTLLLLAPGPLYAGYKIHEQGWPPIDAEGRAAYLARQVDGFRAVAAMNELEGRDYTVYALYGENLRYYADGRFLGDWFGPARFSRIEAVLGDAGELAGELERLGACFFLIRHPRPRQLVTADPRHFQELAAGDRFVLYRLPNVACSRYIAQSLESLERLGVELGRLGSRRFAERPPGTLQPVLDSRQPFLLDSGDVPVLTGIGGDVVELATAAPGIIDELESTRPQRALLRPMLVGADQGMNTSLKPGSGRLACQPRRQADPVTARPGEVEAQKIENRIVEIDVTGQ